MRLSYVVLIHESKKVIRELADGKRHRATGAMPVASGINCVHMKMRRECFGLVNEVSIILAVAVKKEQGEPRAIFRVKQLNVSFKIANHKVIIALRDRCAGSSVSGEGIAMPGDLF